MPRKDAKKLFDKYYSRIVREGVLKSLVFGLIVCFSAMTLVATLTWLLNFEGALWVTLTCGAVALAVSAPIFYFACFRPTTEAIAKRLDGLGLEERLITMLELEKDESYVAMRQREDAKAKLNTVNVKQIKLVLSKAVIVTVAILFVASVSMTTVSALSASDVIPPVIGGDDNAPVYFDVSYVVLGYKGGEEFVEDEGGIIIGEFDQVVESGQSTTTVVAVADDGWFFLFWMEDGSTDPERSDANIEEDTTFTAVFIMAQESDDDQAEGDEGEGEPSDMPQESEIETPPAPPEPSDDPSQGGGSYTNNDMVKDGETNYKDLFDEYYRQAMEILSNGGDIPDELREMLEKYFEMLL